MAVGQPRRLLWFGMDKSLYSELRRLVETMPDLGAFTLPPEAVPWVGEARGLVHAVMGDGKDLEDLKTASERLGSIVYRWESAQQIAAIVYRALGMARSGAGRRWAPEWIDRLEDKVLSDLLGELYGAFNSGYGVLAAIGVRTAFDRATKTLGIDPDLTFADKLKKAESEKYIGGREKNALSVVVDAGSAAAHRGWRPTDDNLAAMLDALESFLHREFVINRKLVAIKDTIPPRH
jgi:hypothetical protein